MGIQCWPDLVKFGAREHLQQQYAGLLLGEAETEPEYNVSLLIDLEKLPAAPGTWIHPADALSAGLYITRLLCSSVSAYQIIRGESLSSSR
jgi:hypothetical protein